MTDTKQHPDTLPTNETEAKSTLLSDLGFLDELYLSLNYHNVWINKSGWLAKIQKRQTPLDIDIACILFDKNHQQQEIVWFKNLRDHSQSICHYGDNLHGYQTTEEKLEHREFNKNKSEGREKIKKLRSRDVKQQKHERSMTLSPQDLEYINIKLRTLPDNIHHIALVTTSFQNSPMSQVPSGEVELRDLEGNTAIRVDFPYLDARCCSLWVASLLRSDTTTYRDNEECVDWHLQKQEKILVHGDMNTLSNQIKQSIEK